MRTICRIGPHIERKRDIIANDWVPRPSGPGFDRIPAPLCAVARWVPHPPRRAVGETESGIPRVAPSSFWLEGDRMAAVSDHVLLLPPSPFGRGAGGEGMSRNLKNNQSNPFLPNRKEDTPIHQNPTPGTPPFRVGPDDNTNVARPPAAESDRQETEADNRPGVIDSKNNQSNPFCRNRNENMEIHSVPHSELPPSAGTVGLVQMTMPEMHHGVLHPSGWAFLCLLVRSRGQKPHPCHVVDLYVGAGGEGLLAGG